LDPIEVAMPLPGEDKSTWYLQTSPEQLMKRLLASGLGSIYQVGPVFRAAEMGHFHNPEFTMAEWYDVGAGFEDGLSLLDHLLQHLLKTPAADRIRFESAFNTATGIELFASTVDDLAQYCIHNAIVQNRDWSNDWDDWVNLIFSERVQAGLGLGKPQLVTHFPASQAALAKVCEVDSRTAERFEAFYCGIELANGYNELVDAEELLERSQIANQQRVLDGKGELPLPDRLLEAMRSGMPNACGCALGFDRIAMLACGASAIDQVIAFTSDNA
jgi:elongation factor P--(R)-beta-lysine ligase